MSQGEPPVVRGRHMKSLVEALQRWEGGARPLALLPAGALQTVTRASGLDWLPMALNVQVTRAVYDGLGALEADRFFRAHTLASFEGPLLQTLVSTGVRMFGLDPASFARWVPKGWHLIFRGVGEWSVGEGGAGGASLALTLRRLPAECADDPVWLRSVSRSISAIFDVTRVSGRVDLQPRPRGATEVRFELSWTPAR